MSLKYKPRLEGFSLIEVSVALLIIGIISSISMNQLKITNKLYTNQKTHEHMDFVIKALAAYCIAMEGELPYPSSLEKSIGLADPFMKNSFGIVPFKSLGIMEKFAKDGKGRWILYKINPSFNSESHNTSNLGINEFHSDIPNDKVAFILKSQNKDGSDEFVVWYSERTFISNFTHNLENLLPKNDQDFSKPI